MHRNKAKTLRKTSCESFTEQISAIACLIRYGSSTDSLASPYIFLDHFSFIVIRSNKMELDNILEEILNHRFGRKEAEEQRRTVVKTTKDGRRHWFPIELNAGLERRDVAWTYGDRTVSGAFYYTNGRIGYDERQKKWKQIARDDKETFESNIPVVLFDKIKVISCVVMIENASRTLAATGAVGVQMRTKRGTNERQTDVFLQEVSKCASPLGTVARYKLIDLSNLNHAHYHVTDEAYTININMPRGFHELAVILRSIAAWHRCKNSESRFVPRVVPEEENNNSITADSIISSVRNELTFKEKAVSSENFPLLTKAQFRTHKYIVRYTGKHTLAGNNPDAYPDVINAVNCTCTNCRETKNCSNRKDTFHRHRRYRFYDCTDTEYRSQCLAPLKEKNEIQVHDRCFNCSAVSSIKLLPVICEIGGKLLQNKQTALIDTTLVRTTTLLEILANGLLPSHISMFCEILCWQMKTRDMSLREQMRVYQKLEPVLSKIQLSRQNYAQSGQFCQAMVRGHKLVKFDDQSIVSHKYNNEETVKIFKVRKRSLEEDNNKKRHSLGKHPRRNRGPVYMATCGLDKFRERMILHGMEYPRADEL